MHHGLRNEFRSDPRSYEHFWTSSWHKARTGFEPMTHNLFITARITSVFVSSTAVHIYDFQSLFTTWKVYLDPVSRALHQYLRGHGFNPYRPEFFSGPISATSSVVSITARITSVFVSSTAVHIYDFHIFTVIIQRFGTIFRQQLSKKLEILTY